MQSAAEESRAIETKIGDLTTECDLVSFAGKNISSVIEAWNKHCREAER